jgi:hypothetical protein
VTLFIFSDTTHHRIRLIYSHRPGLTLTQAWTTANALDTKLELDNNIAKGLKAEILTQYQPAKQSKGAKLNLYFKQPNLHARAFFDLLNGPTANLDAVLGHEGFLVGAEGGYDVTKAAITKYSAAVGYSVPSTPLPSPPATTCPSSPPATTTASTLRLRPVPRPPGTPPPATLSASRLPPSTAWTPLPSPRFVHALFVHMHTC